MTVAQRLFWLWRLFATALSFAMFGLGGVLAPLLVVPTLYLLPGGKKARERRARLVVHGLFKCFIHFMRLLGLLRWELIGAEKLQRPGLLILANHPTLLDVVFLVAFIPNANCIVKSRLFSNPAMRGFISFTGYLANDSGSQLVDGAGQALQSGSALVIFPEGTRSRSGQPISLQRGAANIAVRCQTAVTPVLIRCNPPTLSKEHLWYHVPAKPFVMSFEVKDDIALAPFMTGASSQGARQLTRYLEIFFTTEVHSMTIDSLKAELKQLIIDTLELEDISAGDIVDGAPLFNDGLGLDSIDALEIGVALQKRYGIKLDPEKDEIKKHFASINDLASLVSAHQAARSN